MVKESICLFTHPESSEGTFSQFRDISKILTTLSFKVILLTGKSYLTSNSNVEVCRIFESYENKKNVLTIFSNYIKSNCIALKVIFKMRNQFKTIIFYNSNYVLVILLSKILRKKIIVLTMGDLEICGTFWYKGHIFGYGDRVASIFFRSLRKISFFFADKIIFEYYNQIQDLDFNNSSKIEIAPIRMIDQNFFSIKTPLKKRKLIIGYVGRFSDEKGVINFIESIPNVLSNYNNLKVYLIGGGPLEKKIKEKINKLGLVKNVKIVGWVNHVKLPEWLNKMQLIVIPSYTEALPGIMLEAIYCGVPVLANNVGGIGDIIMDQQTGFLMTDNSPKSISENIIKALEFNTEIITRDAYEKVVDEFGYNNILKKWEEALDGK